MDVVPNDELVVPPNYDGSGPVLQRPAARASKAGRSAADYSSVEDLRSALDDPQQSEDWRLPVPDHEAEEQTVEGELRRLWALKSYLVLDAEKEEAFDRITEEARQVYNVPTSLISLVDLGRQFLFSNTGNPGDVRESSRDIAFCAHTILNKNGILVINDTTKDERFKNNVLVTQPPFLRFYAAAPLVSPEGYKIGTFCVEGPEPRPEGLTPEEEGQLKEFAERTMELMVERRQQLSEKLRGPIGHNLRLHASVTTNLGGILYRAGELHAAMRLFQESVQTLMWEEDSSVPVPGVDRQQEMLQLLNLLGADGNTLDSRRALLKRLCFLTGAPASLDDETMAGEAAESSSSDAAPEEPSGSGVDATIPGMFSENLSRLKGYAARRHENPLVFGEAFQISLEEPAKGEDLPVDFRTFIIPLNQCAKATLFNMGLVHYRWKSPDTAMQFFDLAASLSQATAPLTFDPVVLGCLNNMAQINLQYGRPNDAMGLLSDALTRGNAALTTLYDDYRLTTGEVSPCDFELDVVSRRLRRKLARTVLNMGHVHYFNCEYDASLQTCIDALKLLHATNFEDAEAAASWYNIALLHHLKGHREQAVENLDKFLGRAFHLVGASSPQVASALYRKALVLFEMGNLQECEMPLSDSLSIRRSVLGNSHEDVAESLVLLGKVLQARQDYDAALRALEEAVSILRARGGEHALETALALLELGRVQHSRGSRQEAIRAYEEVIETAQGVFGERHPFIARLLNILGNLYAEVGNVEESKALFARASTINLEHGLPTAQLERVQEPLAA
jgi:tetratricopeptide (TPR) repeat protein